MIPSRPLALALVLAVSCVSCGSSRPNFSIDTARAELAEAFDLGSDDVSLLSDGRPPGVSDEWWVDFRLPVFRETLQARFVGRDAVWVLEGVRKRPPSGTEADWEDVGAMLGEARALAAESAAATVATMRELAAAIEAYAVDFGNEFPTTDIAGLSRLLTRDRYLERWEHGDDGWGNRFHYSASSSGDAYILVSRGSDNRFDIPLEDYQAKTDSGDFAYDGLTSDPARDLIYATGSFVQRFSPGE